MITIIMTHDHHHYCPRASSQALFSCCIFILQFCVFAKDFEYSVWIECLRHTNSESLECFGRYHHHSQHFLHHLHLCPHFLRTGWGGSYPGVWGGVESSSGGSIDPLVGPRIHTASSDSVDSSSFHARSTSHCVIIGFGKTTKVKFHRLSWKY